MTGICGHSYGESKYWDDRYSKEGTNVAFDWYQRYESLSALLDLYVRKESELLVVGCGNAGLSEEMVEDGYQHIMNIDISPVVIDIMTTKHADNKRLSYKVMDVRNLEFGDDTFDAVIDKGTLDSIMCGDSSLDNARRMLSEISRVLKPDGVYVLVTYGDPRSRMLHLESPDFHWFVQLHVLPRPGAEIEGHTEESVKELMLQTVRVGEDNRLVPSGIHLDSGNVHYIYVCRKHPAGAAAQTTSREEEPRPSIKEEPASEHIPNGTAH